MPGAASGVGGGDDGSSILEARPTRPIQEPDQLPGDVSEDVSDAFHASVGPTASARATTSVRVCPFAELRLHPFQLGFSRPSATAVEGLIYPACLAALAASVELRLLEDQMREPPTRARRPGHGQ